MANEYLNNRTFESIIKKFQYYKRQKHRYEIIISDLQETHDRRHAKHSDDKREAVLIEMKKDYEKTCDGLADFKAQLAYAFHVLSENIANYAKFTGIDIDDATQEGVLICLEKIDRFDPRKGKAFNYMTTCILNHLRQMYRSSRSYTELKKKYHDFLLEKLENTIVRNGRENINSEKFH